MSKIYNNNYEIYILMYENVKTNICEATWIKTLIKLLFEKFNYTNLFSFKWKYLV